MNIQDFFRSFMGLNSEHYNKNSDREDPVNKFRNPPWGDDPDEDDEFDELYNDYRSGPSSFGFNIFSGDAIQMHKFFEHQMSEMMKSFGSFGFNSFDFGQGFNGLPEGENTGRKSLVEREEADIRDRYLKAPIGKPQFDSSSSRTDSDIDERVHSDGIGALFKKEPDGERLRERSIQPKSFSRSFTSRVIINNNGRVEERVREWNSDGSETERVVRKLGDQTHSITNKKDKQGLVQQEEQLINIDQDSLSDFDKKWSSSKTSEVPTTAVSPPGSTNPHDGALGIFSPLFRLFS